MMQNYPPEIGKIFSPPKDAITNCFVDPQGNAMPPMVCANKFNEYFEDVSTDEPYPLPQYNFACNHFFMASIIIYPDDINNIIQNFPHQSSPGADGISSKLFK